MVATRTLVVSRLPPGKDRADLYSLIRESFPVGFSRAIFLRDGRTLLSYQDSKQAVLTLQSILEETTIDASFSTDDEEYVPARSKYDPTTVIRLKPNCTPLTPEELEKILSSYAGFEKFGFLEEQQREGAPAQARSGAWGSSTVASAIKQVYVPYACFSDTTFAEIAVVDLLAHTNIVVGYATRPDQTRKALERNMSVPAQYAQAVAAATAMSSVKPSTSSSNSPSSADIRSASRTADSPVAGLSSQRGANGFGTPSSSTGTSDEQALFIPTTDLEPLVGESIYHSLKQLPGFERMSFTQDGLYVWFETPQDAEISVSVALNKYQLHGTLVSRSNRYKNMAYNPLADSNNQNIGSLFVRCPFCIDLVALERIFSKCEGFSVAQEFKGSLVVDFNTPQNAEEALKELKTRTNIKIDFAHHNANEISQISNNDISGDNIQEEDVGDCRALFITHIGRQDKSEIMDLVSPLPGFVRIQFGTTHLRVVLEGPTYVTDAVRVLKNKTSWKIELAHKEPETRKITDPGEPSKTLWVSTLYWSESDLCRFMKKAFKGFQKISYEDAHSYISFDSIAEATEAMEVLNKSTNLYAVFSGRKGLSKRESEISGTISGNNLGSQISSPRSPAVFTGPVRTENTGLISGLQSPVTPFDPSRVWVDSGEVSRAIHSDGIAVQQLAVAQNRIAFAETELNKLYKILLRIGMVKKDAGDQGLEFFVEGISRAVRVLVRNLVLEAEKVSKNDSGADATSEDTSSK